MKKLILMVLLLTAPLLAGYYTLDGVGCYNENGVATDCDSVGCIDVTTAEYYKWSGDDSTGMWHPYTGVYQLQSTTDTAGFHPLIWHFFNNTTSPIIYSTAFEAKDTLTYSQLVAIKAKTDPLTFTATNYVQADIQYYEGNTDVDGSVQSEATDALNAYDPPTNAEMEARTIGSGAADNLELAFDAAGDTVSTTGLANRIAALSDPSAADIVDEWETQSQADPTGFHVNLMEARGDAVPDNGNGVLDANVVSAANDAIQLADLDGPASWWNEGKTGYSLAADGLDSDSSFTQIQGAVAGIAADYSTFDPDADSVDARAYVVGAATDALDDTAFTSAYYASWADMEEVGESLYVYNDPIRDTVNIIKDSVYAIMDSLATQIWATSGGGISAADLGESLYVYFQTVSDMAEMGESLYTYIEFSSAEVDSVLNAIADAGKLGVAGNWADTGLAHAPHGDNFATSGSGIGGAELGESLYVYVEYSSGDVDSVLNAIADAGKLGKAGDAADTLLAHAPHGDNFATSGSGIGGAELGESLYVYNDSVRNVVADANKVNFKADVSSLPTEAVLGESLFVYNDSIQNALADANKTNFKADVSALALEASVTAIRDSMDEAAQTGGAGSDSTTVYEATMDAMLDLFLHYLFAAAMNTDSTDNSSLGEIVIDSLAGQEWATSGSAGSGSGTCSLFVLDTSGTDALVNATVTVKSDDQSSTHGILQSESGGKNAVFSLDDADYYVLAVAAGYVISAKTVTVSGTTKDTLKGYNIDPGAAGDPDKCRVYGYLKDTKGTALEGAKITMTLTQPGEDDLSVSSSQIVGISHTAWTDTSGYWYIDLIPNADLDTSTYYNYTVAVPSGTAVAAPKNKPVKVPDSVNVNIVDLL